jgi:rhomboid protease GluP
MDAAEQPLRITPDMLLARRVDFERRMRRLPPLTVGLIGLLGVVFLAELAGDALESPGALVAAGALESGAVRAGQYWRLLSATFLHGGIDHLIGNVVALLILGMVCEHAFGRRQFALLYLASAIAGSLLSLAVSTGPSVGASGAIFGLQGAAIVLFRRHRDRLLVRDRRIGLVLLAWALYAIANGLMTPWIDNGAHIGGMLGGALVSRHWHPVVLEPMPPAHEVRVRWAMRAAGLVLAYAALGWLGR